jgi:hypothetical protein
MFILAHNDPTWIMLGAGIGIAMGFMFVKWLYHNSERR